MKRFSMLWIILLALAFLSACSEDSVGQGTSSLETSASQDTSASADPTASIYISEYVEGSGNNKYIELYNPRGTPFSLSGWSLRQYPNGANEPSGGNYTLNLSGNIPAGGVFVIRNSQATIWSGTANMSDGLNTMGYNGNDAMGLFNGATLVDIVGTPGKIEMHIQDMTLVRRPGKGPSVTFNIADWYVLGINDVSNLGQRDPVNGIEEPSDPGGHLPIEYPKGTEGSVLFISEYFSGVDSDKYIELWNDSNFAIDLSGYRLVRIAIDNTGATNTANSYCMQLYGNLNPKHVLVIVHGEYVQARFNNTIRPLPTSTSGNSWKIVENPSDAPHGISFLGGNDPVYLIDARVAGQEKVIDMIGEAAGTSGWGINTVWLRVEANKQRGNPEWNEDDGWICDDLFLDPEDPNTYANFGADWGGWHGAW